jgi:hypothetical protein
MRILSILILFNIIFGLHTYSQDGKKYFIDAYKEQLAMLQGQKPIDFKKSVFLTENSFYKGALNYQSYCSDITTIGLRLKLLIHNRHYEKYKTAGNWAAFMYICIWQTVLF